MQANRNELVIAIDFLEDNRDSATIIEYIAKKYGLQINPDKTLTENANSLISYLRQYTSGPPLISPQPRKIKLEYAGDFDLPSYMGLWYTAASIPQPFDRDTAWKTAEYELLTNTEPSIVKVTNTGYNEDGSIRGKIVGTAEVLDPNNPAALYVSFPTGTPRQSNPRANYIVHSTNYTQYAIVGSYDGSNLYILVRERPISRYFYNLLVKYPAQLGYDTTLLREDYQAIEG